MPIKIVKNTISKNELTALAQGTFGDFVKAVVDIERGIAALGGELHADEEAVLLEDGSKQENLWGVNLYPEKSEEWIEFNSMINVRPSQGNKSRGVESHAIREKIQNTITTLVVE